MRCLLILTALTFVCTFSVVASAQPTFSAPVNLSTPSVDSRELTIALSRDGTRATAVWLEFVGLGKKQLKTSTATISGGAATWGSVMDLSAADISVAYGIVRMSADGSGALVVWHGTDSSKASVVESRSATISGNTASWGAVTRLNRSSTEVGGAHLALSADGTRAYAVWGRSVKAECSVAVGSFAIVSGASVSWGTPQQISEQGGCVSDVDLGLAASGGAVSVVWASSAAGKTIIVRVRTGVVNSSTVSWGSVTDLSAPGFDSKNGAVAMSADGTKVTVVWARAGVNPVTGRSIEPILVRSRSATVSGNVATWSATTVLSATTDASIAPRLGISSDGTSATASWIRIVKGVYSIESISATISGNVASWGTVTTISGSGKIARGLSLSLSSDGSKALATWARVASTKLVMQGTSGIVSGATQSWGSPFTLSTPTQTALTPNGVFSADGAVAIFGWHESNTAAKNTTYTVRASAAEFMHPTPTPTPAVTNTPTTTPTPAPTTTPVGTPSDAAPTPITYSNDHYVTLRVRDTVTNSRRDYYGYLLRASDNKLVKMGKFKVRRHQGRLEFHDVPPGIYRTFTVVIRSKAPKVISSRQRTIVVK